MGAGVCIVLVPMGLLNLCACNLRELMGLKKPCAVKEGTWVRLPCETGLCGRLEAAVLEGAAGAAEEGLLLMERLVGCVMPLRWAYPCCDAGELGSAGRGTPDGGREPCPSSEMADEISLRAVSGLPAMSVFNQDSDHVTSATSAAYRSRETEIRRQDHC